ncbi:hypothetical protein [Candidatus Magnetaquicoccus inordinatus]|uniref:hypothetical protein n=1 Tax=Candidatus Magnetaquicoccus inordinatus TaxID=2496818 RepID=UPI00102B9F7A|nr:hypothetical protein [Candidatus Magnetaquicoccus inordinatus]
MSDTASFNRRSKERVFCGLPMEFEGHPGNALDINEHAVFLVLSLTSHSIPVGKKGILTLELNGQKVEEKVKVARVTDAGLSIVSVEETSIFPQLIDQSRSGLKHIHHTERETIAHFRGKFSADIWTEFYSMQEGKASGRLYRLDFTNVVHVASSGIAMLLLLEAENDGGIVLCNCKKEVMKELSQLQVPGIDISFFHDRVVDTDHQFVVTVEKGHTGQDVVTVRIARMFDYNCRNDFANIYRSRSKKSIFVLDFQDTYHVGKAAFGTLLLLNQHIRGQHGEPARIINCSSSVRQKLLDMKFDRYFTIE